MLVVTTPTVAGYRIVKHLGIASGEAILGANIFRDLFAGIRDIIGGRFRSAGWAEYSWSAPAVTAVVLQAGE